MSITYVKTSEKPLAHNPKNLLSFLDSLYNVDSVK